jgi:hypothetical protein
MSRTASFGCMSMLSDLPGADLTVIFGAFLSRCSRLFPEVRVSPNSRSVA